MWTDVGGGVVEAFSTPVFRYRRPAVEVEPVNDRLRTEILARRDREGGRSLSNVGGWQSEPDVDAWDNDGVEVLLSWIDAAFHEVMTWQLDTPSYEARYVRSLWANVNERGDANATHIHGNSHWSGIYYVACETSGPDDAPYGALELIDPRPAAGVYRIPHDPAATGWVLRPEPGLLLMFPSWLRHGVLGHQGDEPRVSVAFNLRVEEVVLADPPQGPTV